MPKQGMEKTPLQQIMSSVESSVRDFGLPSLPPISLLVPGRREEKSEEVTKPITSILKEGDVREDLGFKPGSLTKRDDRYSHVDFDASKMNIYSGRGKGEITPLESKIVPRQIFVERDEK